MGGATSNTRSTPQAARKHFFFEKKKQKTFIYWPTFRVTPGRCDWPKTDKSFLVLFFKKEHSVLLLLPLAMSSAMQARAPVRNQGPMLPYQQRRKPPPQQGGFGLKPRSVRAETANTRLAGRPRRRTLTRTSRL
jgi:hypothetical protein